MRESLPEMDHKLSTFIQLQSIKQKFIYFFDKKTFRVNVKMSQRQNRTPEWRGDNNMK